MTRLDPLRVCLYSGLNVAADAISNAVRLKLQVLGDLRDEGFPVEAWAFVQGTDDPDPRVIGAPTAFDVIGNPRFGAADLHLFEFGIAYELFDLIFLTQGLAPTGAMYHNVTPVELVSETNRASIERSLRQRYNLFAAQHVACVSELNRRDLVAIGIPEDRLSVSPLPPAIVASEPRTSFGAAEPGPLRLLFVGRLVRAKGVLDLLEAVAAALVTPAAPELHLTIVGNEQLSEPEVADEVRRRLAEPPLAGQAEFAGRVDDDALGRLYARSDVLVMPSYHEGYCVPVVEALSAGAYVVAYDAANLPFVVDGLGSLVPAGDVDGLRTVLVDLAARFAAARRSGAGVVLPAAGGELQESAWRARVRDHVADYSFPAFRRRFVEQLALLASLRPEGAPSWLAEAAGAAVPAGVGRLGTA